MEFILDHKWTFLVTAEVVFWISILSFLTARYWFQLYGVSWLFFGLFILNDLWIATMGYFDYLRTGDFSSYQIIILVILVYALTYGKTDMKRLDRFIQRKVAEWKGEELVIEGPTALYGKEHARQERKDFAKHLGIFLIVNVGFYLVSGFSDGIKNISSLEGLFTEWVEQEKALIPFENRTLNQIMRVWTLVLVIDGLFSFSYTLFPKRKRFSNNETSP